MPRLAALLFVVCLSCGCFNAGPPDTGGGATPAKQLRIGMMPKLVGISYFDATQRGAEEAAAELGVQLVYDGPTDDSVEDQVKMIDGWVAQGLDVIAVAPNDPEAIARTLENAGDVGATVLTWDTDANPEKSKRNIFVNQAPNEAVGRALVDVMVDGVKARGQEVAGKYLMISGTPTASNQNTWMAIMREYIAESYPEIELLDTLYPGEDQRNALEQASEAVSVHADVKGIWGLTSMALPATAKAVRDAGKGEQIFVTGLSLPSLTREYVKDGTIGGFVLWDAVDLGYLTVHVAKRLSEGPLEDGTYDMGRLTGIEVRDGQAILGPPTIFTAENIDQFEF